MRTWTSWKAAIDIRGFVRKATSVHQIIIYYALSWKPPRIQIVNLYLWKECGGNHLKAFINTQVVKKYNWFCVLTSVTFRQRQWYFQPLWLFRSFSFVKKVEIENKRDVKILVYLIYLIIIIIFSPCLVNDKSNKIFCCFT